MADFQSQQPFENQRVVHASIPYMEARDNLKSNYYFFNALPRWVNILLCTICVLLVAVVAIAIANLILREKHDEKDVHWTAWTNAGAFPWLKPNGEITSASAPIDDGMRIVPARTLPSSYTLGGPATAKYILVFGDGTASGSGVTNIQQTWFNIFKARFMPLAQVLKFSQPQARVSQLQHQFEAFRDMFPNGIDGPAIVFVACGMDDLLDALGDPALVSGANTNPSMIEMFVQTIIDNTSSFPHGVYVYLVDYADASNGLGHIDPLDHVCTPPLDAKLNALSANPSPWSRALLLHSAALASIARRKSVAAIATHYLFARNGFNRAYVRALPPALEDSTVIDNELFQDCTLLSSEGQSALANVVWAYVKNEPVSQLV